VRGTVATMPLIPAVVDAVSPTPVVAAGGIGDGRGLAAALALGAAGAWVGTRFLASQEATIHPRYRELLLQASENDTVFVDELFDVGWPKAPHRVFAQQDRRGVGSRRAASFRPAPGRRGSDRHIGDAQSGCSLPVPHARRRNEGRYRCALALGRKERRSVVERAERRRHRTRDCQRGRDHHSTPVFVVGLNRREVRPACTDEKDEGSGRSSAY
jgi:Nitronate monooxygenase